MTKNVGGADRGIRLVLGIGLLVLAFLHVITGTLAIAAYVVGGIALITGLVQICPAWSIFGINTCSTAHKQS
jgi:Inner membrane protein YgaP-like, transmembrane domain